MGRLSLSDEQLDRIAAGNLVIGDNNVGQVTVAANVTRTSSTNMRIVTGASIVFDAGRISTAGGGLVLQVANTTDGIQPKYTGTDVTADTLSFACALKIDIGGRDPGNGSGATYSQLSVIGAVDLTGAQLLFGGAYIP